MSKVFTFITAKVLPNILLILITGATASVGVYTATKVSDPQTGIINKSVKEVLLADTQKKTTTENKDGSTKPNKNTVTDKNLCLVKISGKVYNVFNLRKTHSGGDIFVCDTDMTASYTSQHGSNLSRMSSYLYTSNVSDKSFVENKPTTTSNSITKTSTSNKGYDKASLATHNNANSCYVAYKGVVYNVTGLAVWANCIHHGVSGGIDITGLFPHSTSYLTSLPVVGKISGSTTGTSGGTTSKSNVEDDEDEREDERDEDDDDEKDDDHEDDEDEKEIEIED